ncbi:MAG: ypmQ [Gammaproteobacteria bacterium]|jgi:protein SCO1/2|nr:ypmQ [Gammaproteobacteria bacterium]
MKILARLFLILTCLLGNMAFADELKLKSGLMIPVAKNLSPFTLTQYVANPSAGKSNAQAFTNENLKGKWTLMFFGFTNCPMLCPTSMAQLSNAYQQLQTKNFSPLPQVVFVSVDPERDTLEKVHTFATTFNPAFIGVRTADVKALNQMTREMDVVFEKVAQPASITGDKDSKSNYTINHSGDIAVINPQGQFAAILTMPHETQDLVADYETIVTNAPQTQSSGGFLSKLFGKS